MTIRSFLTSVLRGEEAAELTPAARERLETFSAEALAEGALTLVRTGLENYPQEKGLQQLQATLIRAQAGDAKEPTRAPAAAAPPPARLPTAAPPGPPPLGHDALSAGRDRDGADGFFDPS